MLVTYLIHSLGLAGVAAAASRPNIVFIMSDDQDRLLNSVDYQSSVQELLINEGTEFVNHHTNTALCCPSRSSLLRGQTVHNTNMTNVVVPGGSYNKWVVSEQDKDYLPFWLSKAGYRNEYVGKIMNGYGLSNYNVTPKGWDHTDVLLEPYIDDYNAPVLSENGKTPVFYKGYHQTDVVRIKSLQRLDALAKQDKPFSLFISPFAPHVGKQANKAQSRPIPQKRHWDLFKDIKAPRTPNFNPDDKYQQTKGGWVGYLPKMDQDAIDFADYTYRNRLQSIKGVDEIVEDVVKHLKENDLLDNTYIIYTSDNGYKVGQHRFPAGKSLYFAEDTNLPFIVRGPNVPKGVKSKLPSLHLDLAPTFLDIAGVNEKDWPEFFDGRSLLDQWHKPQGNTGEGDGQGNGRESVNVEYWGLTGIEAPSGGKLGSPFYNTTYKTIRTLGEDQSWLYTKWCNGDTELYNITGDKYELTNLVPAGKHSAIEDRLNALLMVAKSCEQGACRDPWGLLDPPDGARLHSLTQALDEDYDDYFNKFEKVSFDQCLSIQSAENEAPHYPPIKDSSVGLGREYRKPTVNIPVPKGGFAITVDEYYGTVDQRTATFDELMKNTRDLTEEEINTP